VIRRLVKLVTCYDDLCPYFSSNDLRAGGSFSSSLSCSTMRISSATTIFYLALALLHYVSADPVSLPFTDCSDPHANNDQKFQIHTVYGQVLRNTQWGHYLNLTVFGTSPAEILGSSNTSILCKYSYCMRLGCSFNSVFSDSLYHNFGLDAKCMVK